MVQPYIHEGFPRTNMSTISKKYRTYEPEHHRQVAAIHFRTNPPAVATLSKMDSDDDDGAVSASAAAAVQQEEVVALMNAPVGAAAMQTQQEALPPLAEVFHDIEHFSCFTDANGKPRWRCNWCHDDFGGHNASKALYHVAKVARKGIKVCPAAIPDNHYKRYYNLYEKKMGAKSTKAGKCYVYFKYR